MVAWKMYNIKKKNLELKFKYQPGCLNVKVVGKV